MTVVDLEDAAEREARVVLDEYMVAEDFLDIVWEEREGWIDLPSRVNGYWVYYYMEWPPENEWAVSARIDNSFRDEEDLYYSVAMFKRRGRKLEDVMPLAWLWADLDAVHPSAATRLGLMPTLAVETSLGRYQALWRLDRLYAPQVVEKLNKGLTYALGADRGGWDLTQVLRIPGTRNHKYADRPLVRVMWYREELVYEGKGVWQAVKAHVPKDELAGAVGMALPKRDIPRKARQLLLTKSDQVVMGERSARLWELSCLLAEAGCTETEIYDLVVVSAWNKWAGQRGMEGRLRRDVRKALRHVRSRAAAERDAGAGKEAVEAQGQASTPTGMGKELSFISFASLMTMSIKDPRWLVEDVWVDGTHGFIGGEPKTSKTMIALALGMSVASGSDFLGKYPVRGQGPVLMIEEENGLATIKSRMVRLSIYLGVAPQQDAIVHRSEVGSLTRVSIEVDMPRDIPFWVMSKVGFDLSEEQDREFLRRHVEEIQPRLVIIDPVSLTFRGVDINSMADLQPIFLWIHALGEAYGCSVVLVHHMGKRNETTAGRRGGQRLVGSTTLHGFSGSALYTSRVARGVGGGSGARGDGWTHVSVEREFRATREYDPFEVAWRFGDDQDLEIEVGEPTLPREKETIVRLEAEREDNGLLGKRTQATVAQLAREKGVGVKTIRRHVQEDSRLDIADRGPGMSPMVYRISPNGN